MSIDTISTPTDHIELEQLEFHPLVRAELMRSLAECRTYLDTARPEQVAPTQGAIQKLKWILGLSETSEGMLKEIVAKEREKAKKAEGKE